MKPNEILEKLIGQTKALHAVLVSLRNEQGALHELDRDSVRHQLRDMYTLTGQLLLNTNESGQHITETGPLHLEEPEIRMEIKEENSGLQTAFMAVLEESGQATEAVSAPTMAAVKEEMIHQPAPWPDEPAIHAGMEETLPTESVGVPPSPQAAVKPESNSVKSLADRFAPSETVGDLMQRNQPVQRVSDRLRSTSLSDLHESIGINERFTFINQLFKGDQARYFEAINRLNASHSQEEAIVYLNQELLPGMAWKTPPAAWKEFFELVSRRYQA